jgi:hypothetical protein
MSWTRKTRSLAAGLFLAAIALPAAGASASNGLPANPDYFPLAVWLQSPSHAEEYKALGINLFIGLWQGPTEAQLTALSRQGMDVIAEQNLLALASPNRAVIKGWMQGDEPDNAQHNPLGGYFACIPAAEVAARSAALKATDPSRPVYINFGQGVANPGWVGRGVCHGDMAYYDTAVRDADIVSFDMYPAASDDPAIRGKLDFVARGVDNLVRRAGPGQAVWAVLETTYIQAHNRVTPEQLRNEIWMAIVHGARGIVYFVHEWTGGFREDGIFRHPEIVAEVIRTNQTIKALAPVLNSADAEGRISAPTVGPATRVRIKDGFLYVFASSSAPGDTDASFVLKGLGNATATVIDEGRAIPVINGKLADHFGPYAAHIYKVPLAGR